MSRKDTLFVTDAQLAERMGLETQAIKDMLPELHRQGFPEPDPLFKGRRYWPACKVFLDRRYNIGEGSGITAPPGLDGEENWDNVTKVGRSR